MVVPSIALDVVVPSMSLGVMEDSHCIALHTLGMIALEVVVDAVVVASPLEQCPLESSY